MSDVCSAFYPLGVASPVLRGLDLERHGLDWRHAPAVLAHLCPDGRCAVLDRDPDATAASPGALGRATAMPGCGCTRLWERLGSRLLRAILTPFPPVRAAALWRARLGPADAPAPGPVACAAGAPLARRSSRGDGRVRCCWPATPCTPTCPRVGGQRGVRLAADDARPAVGLPVPAGGAVAAHRALVRRLEARGGRVRCGTRVTSVIVRDGRALGVRTADGEAIRARRAVLADVAGADAVRRPGRPGAPAGAAPSRTSGAFQWDFATFKVDWALSGPIPWSAPAARPAGTVHLAHGPEAP